MAITQGKSPYIFRNLIAYLVKCQTQDPGIYAGGNAKSEMGFSPKFKKVIIPVLIPPRPLPSILK